MLVIPMSHRVNMSSQESPREMADNFLRVRKIDGVS